jgi:hypothetical protein
LVLINPRSRLLYARSLPPPDLARLTAFTVTPAVAMGVRYLASGTEHVHALGGSTPSVRWHVNEAAIGTA